MFLNKRLRLGRQLGRNKIYEQFSIGGNLNKDGEGWYRPQRRSYAASPKGINDDISDED